MIAKEKTEAFNQNCVQRTKEEMLCNKFEEKMSHKKKSVLAHTLIKKDLIKRSVC